MEEEEVKNPNVIIIDEWDNLQGDIISF